MEPKSVQAEELLPEPGALFGLGKGNVAAPPLALFCVAVTVACPCMACLASLSFPLRRIQQPNRRHNAAIRMSREW
jgi:hypothetical protein